MGVELNPQSVTDLNEQWPASGEPVKEGAAHLRNIKKTVKTRANVAGVVGVTTLSNAIDSDAEDVAATSKAVKDVSEALASESAALDQKIADFEDAVDAALAGLQFTESKNQNGYVKLPNGLIFQWGKSSANMLNNASSTRSYTQFPIAFPNACFNVQITEGTAGSYSYEGIHESTISIRGVTKTQFEPVNMKTGDRGGTGVNLDFFWFAVGH
jgi:hypothetical protein